MSDTLQTLRDALLPFALVARRFRPTGNQLRDERADGAILWSSGPADQVYSISVAHVRAAAAAIELLPPKPATCGVLAGEGERIGMRCADGATCHHNCLGKCFRRDGCAPLDASALLPDWSVPPGYGATPALDPAAQTKAELYDEVWQAARNLGYGNVTEALTELKHLKSASAETTIDTCDLGHQFAKLADHPQRDGRPRCPHCMACGIDQLRGAASDTAVELAARKLAEVMDYPWDYMPEEGRQRMRDNAQALIAELEQQRGAAIHLIFDGPPGPECGRFVEAEDSDGCSINAGEWSQRPDGYWQLVIKQRSGVVLPERANESEGNSYTVMQAMARNQALDEVARLNPPGECVAVPRTALANFIEYSVHGPYGCDDKWNQDKKALISALLAQQGKGETP